MLQKEHNDISLTLFSFYFRKTMGRDRSPSDRRERRREKDRRRDRDRRDRRRSRSKDRDERSRRENRKKSRSRSRSPIERQSKHQISSEQAWDREREKLRKKEKEREARLAMEAKLTAEDITGKTEEEIDMMKVMGFGGFNTTKNKKVKGNDVGDVHVVVKRKYRQYMNRKGGFNRPLDYVH